MIHSDPTGTQDVFTIPDPSVINNMDAVQMMNYVNGQPPLDESVAAANLNFQLYDTQVACAELGAYLETKGIVLGLEVLGGGIEKLNSNFLGDEMMIQAPDPDEDPGGVPAVPAQASTS